MFNATDLQEFTSRLAGEALLANDWLTNVVNPMTTRDVIRIR